MMKLALKLLSAAVPYLACALLVSALACGSDGGTPPADIATLRFILQPGTSGAGVPFTASVELLSASGERVTSATNQVTVSATGATLGGTTTVAATAGVATFSGLTVNTIGQNIQLVARLGDITTTSSTFNVVAGPATASQSTMTLSTSFPVVNANVTLTFAFHDALGNPVVGATASFFADVAGVTFTPPSGTTDVNGRVTTVFRSPASGPVSISVNVGGTTITLATPINVGSGAGSLRFVTQPPTVTVGQAFSVSVELLDANGQRLTAATNQVALSLSTGGLQGTTTVNAIAGLAAFTNLSVAATASAAILTATSGTLTGQSNPFNITASACASGTLTLGTPVNATVLAGSGCILNNHPAASFSFTIPTGNATVVTLGGTAAGGLSPELAITPNPAGADVIFFSPSPNAPTREWMLPPGNFLASVSSTSGVPGSFTINTTNNGAGAAGCALRNLVGVSATYSGQSLAATDCRDPDPSGAWYEDRYLIFDSRPCVIKMTAGFDAFLQLRETSLVVVTDDDDSGGGQNAQISRPTCRSGPNPYMIAATSFIELDTGPYTLTITFTGSAPGQADNTIVIEGGGSPLLQATTMRDVIRGRVKR